MQYLFVDNLEILILLIMIYVTIPCSDEVCWNLTLTISLVELLYRPDNFLSAFTMCIVKTI